ncbi:MAG TPA: hypothetical protein VHJ37_05210 [Thermoleophilaceae bacterium]|nr:hypothetical protein [Thermoleophilaceae bacterium]
MSRAGRRFLSVVLATAEGLFLEPAEPRGLPVPLAPRAARTVVAIYGLAPGCGTSTVARALAAELGRRDPSGAAGLMCEARASAIPLATPDASRLARAFEELPGTVTRAVGRLALVRIGDPLALAESARHLAPLVLDAGSSALGGVPAAVADLSVIVSTPSIEPSLARVAAECLQRVGPAPVVVLNRAKQGVEPSPSQPGSGYGNDLVVLPESRVGAQLALGGREARGELGRAVATLADRCERRN